MIESKKSQGAIARHWERARRYLAQGQLHAARATFESMRHTDRNDVRTNLLGAEIAWQSGRVREATEYVGLAAIAQTGDPDLACGIMDGLLRAGDCVLARKVLGRPPLANTDSPQLLMRVAGYRQQLGDHPAALESLERIREAGGDTPDSSYYRGQQLIFNGRLQEAEAELESCLQARPEHGRAAQVLARLRRQTPENNHVGRLQEGLGRVTPGTLDHAALEFALYKELEDLERWQEAWSALERGNGVMSRRNRVDVVRFGVFLEQLLARCASSTPRAMREIAGPLPIFVVGLPRSGSTVLERMLGNHPDITAAGELQDFGKQLHWVADTHNLFHTEFLRRLPGLDVDALGRRYLDQTGWRAQGKSFFVDKQLVNWMLVGLIRAALPRARILHIVRPAMDVCFSNWRTYFGDTHAYSYDLSNLAAYHQTYARTMAGWHCAFPGEILDVSYSKLVGSPDETIREVLEFCGLPHAAECVDISRSRAPVATLSSATVRDGLSAPASSSWLPYSGQLSNLRGVVERAETEHPKA